jgi:hypothetical protein
MNPKLNAGKDSQWKMFTHLEDYKNKMVTMRTGWYHIEGYQGRNGISKEEILLTWKVTRMK